MSSDCTAANSRSLFGVTVLKNNHRDVRRLRRAAGLATHHGNKVWNSSLILMDYLSEFPLKKRLRVLEIGCGWGVASIFCAKRFESSVTGLDIDAGIFPFMQHHAELNGVAADNCCGSYQSITSAYLKGFDLMIGADICFWDELSRPLFNLVRRAHRAGTRTILADPGRPPFTQMAERCSDKLHAEFEPWSVPTPYNCSGYILDVPATH